MRALVGVLLAALVTLSMGLASHPAAKAPMADVPMLGFEPMTPCVIHGDVPVTADASGYCGTLAVPEDRSILHGRNVPLRVAVIPAVTPSRESPPLFALAGGPGDAATQFFAWMPDVFTEVHAVRNIVLVDQRGTGDSAAVVVPAMPDTSGLTSDQADARMTAWAEEGFNSTGADARQYSSATSAADLDEVREALGYPLIDLYGSSYGGTLAQYYLRRYPEQVRAAVLDGATPVDVPVLEQMASSSELALDALLARCRSDSACHTAFPALDAEWAVLRARLAQPLETNVVDPTTGEHAFIDLAHAARSIHAALLTEATAARIPLAIHLAYENRWDAAGQVVPGVPEGGSSLLMSDVILCSEPWARFEPEHVDANGSGSYALATELAAAVARQRMCSFVPQAPIAVDEGAPLETRVPMLWLSGDADPQDPPANLTHVAEQQPNATIVVVPAQEHVVGHLGCGPSVVAAFLDAPTKRLDTSCAENRDPGIPFVLDQP